MAATVITEVGRIVIADDVIARAAGMAAMDCYGVVGMASLSAANGFVQLLMGENLTKGIKVNTEDDRLSIEFHIIVDYGTNISAIADNLISTVSYKIKDMLGLAVNEVNVYVEGIRTDNHEE